MIGSTLRERAVAGCVADHDSNADIVEFHQVVEVAIGRIGDEHRHRRRIDSDNQLLLVIL